MKKTAQIFISSIFFLFIFAVVITLITARIGLFGLHSYVVQTGSMEPNIHVASVVFTLPGAYNKGDVITFNRDNKSITHRIVDQKNNMFIVKGDANKVADQQPVRKNDVVGKDFVIIPYIGRFIELIRTVPGFLLFIALPILLYVGFEFRIIKKEWEKEIEKKILKKVATSETA